MKTEGKVFVVTGASGGIGQEIVKLLIKRGGKVAAVDINQNELERVREQLKESEDKLKAYQVDITNKSLVESLPEKVRAELGEPDGLINAAGIIQPFVMVSEIDYERVFRVMNVNFYGTLYMTKTFLPYLLKRPEAHIVNISSMGGFLPVPGQAIYGASKAAVKLLSESLYAELKDTKVKVTVVFPGATETKIAEHSGVQVSQESKEEGNKIPMMKPDEVARIIVDGMEKDKFQIFTGSDSSMMNILYRLNPKFAVDMITKRMSSLLKKR